MRCSWRVLSWIIDFNVDLRIFGYSWKNASLTERLQALRAYLLRYSFWKRDAMSFVFFIQRWGEKFTKTLIAVEGVKDKIVVKI